MSDNVGTKGRVFILDDDELIVMMLGRAIKGAGYTVKQETKVDGVIDKIESFAPDVVLLDVNLPGKNGIDILCEIKEKGIPAQVVMLTSDNSAETAVRAMKMGAADYLTKPFNIDEVKIVINNLIEKANLVHEVEHLRMVRCEYFKKDIIGESPAMLKLKSDIQKLADVRVSCVLITGESGTGKELAARQIHRLMFGDCAAKCKPFIAVNCAALPEHLVESELFGHEKGAFTDAKTDKKGFFELANGGTILLDEIGEMKQDLQSKLLRVLEERTIRRIGGKSEIPVDVVVLATTNKDLNRAVNEGSFRKDLFFRLNAFHLAVPPLRERQQDIPLLAQHFLSTFAARYNRRYIKNFSKEALNMLSAYAWPGNVRELKNLIERLVVLEHTETITPEHLRPLLSANASVASHSAAKTFVLPDEGICLDELEKDLIMQALEKTNNNRAAAAKLLGITYESLRYQIKRFGL